MKCKTMNNLVGQTILNSKILKKLGEARLHFRFVGRADLSAETNF